MSKHTFAGMEDRAFEITRLREVADRFCNMHSEAEAEVRNLTDNLTAAIAKGNRVETANARLRGIITELVEVAGKASFYLRKACPRGGNPVGNKACGCGNCVVADMNDAAIDKAKEAIK